MKIFESSYVGAIYGQVQSLCHLFRIQRQDGGIVALTDFDQDLTVDGLTFSAAEGFTPSNTDQALGSPGTLTVEGFLKTQLTFEDLIKGLYDQAQVDIYRVDWQALPATFDLSPPPFDHILSGTLGNRRYGDQSYSLELLSLSDRLKTAQGWSTQKGCRNQFGDSNCGVDTTPFQLAVTATVVVSPSKIDAGVAYENNRYSGSIATWTTGANAGLSSRVVSQVDAIFEFLRTPPSPIQPGDSFTIFPNCFKNQTDCTKWGNLPRYNGEGTIPGKESYANQEREG